MPARTLAYFLLLAGSVFAQQPKAAGSFEISGTVVDAGTDHPLAQARVAIAPVTARNKFRVVITSQDGAFRFDGVSKGKYTLTAERRGYLTQAFDQHDQYASSIATGSGLESRGLVFRLHSEGKISGKITDEANEPVAVANVSLFQDVSPGELQTVVIRSTAISDDEGNYHFGHLQPGSYFVSVEAQPWYARHLSRPITIAQVKTPKGEESSGASPPQISAEGGPSVDVVYPTTYYPGVSDAPSAGAIELAAGGRFTADLMLQPMRAIPVRVTVGSPDSKRHYNVNLGQRGMGGQLRGMSTTTSEISPGVVEITGIVPGRYVMNVNAWSEDAGTGENPGNSEKEIDIDSTGAVHAHAEPQNAAVSGMVRFDQTEKEQTLPASVFIFLHNKKTAQILSAPVSGKGEYEFKAVPAGAYDVAFSNLPDALASNIIATGARVTGHTLQITGRNAVNANIVLTRGLGRVEGTALLENKPMAGMMIVLAPEDPAHNTFLFRRDQSDSDGTFTLNSVLPGKYTVVAIQDGWKLDYLSPEVLKQFMAQGTPVQVASNGKYDIKVKVQPANSQ